MKAPQPGGRFGCIKKNSNFSQNSIKFKKIVCRILEIMNSLMISLISLLLLWGCGSQSDQPAPASKTASKSVKETALPSKNKGAVPRAVGSLLDDNSKLTPITPPAKPGEFGMTADQLLPPERPKDPSQLPVSPPAKSGERVPTVAEVLKKRAEEGYPDPNKTFVFPPGKSGEKGPTVAEFNQSRKNSLANENPDNFEIGPPSKPGEKGMTVKEFRALREKDPWPNPADIPPPPIGGSSSGSSGAGKKAN
jgi:hypothetical protein